MPYSMLHHGRLAHVEITVSTTDIHPFITSLQSIANPKLAEMRRDRIT